MKKTILVLAAVTLIAANLFANDDCAAAQPSPIVTKKIMAKVTKYKKLSENRDLTESFVLKSGSKVYIKQGGCAHYGINYALVLKYNFKKPNHRKEILKLGLKSFAELSKLGFKIPGIIEFKNLNLKNKYLDIYEYDKELTFELGDSDAYRTVYLVVTRLTKKTSRFTFSEAIAL